MAEEAKNKCFLLLYGSQTGQAKAIAELIFEESTKRGYTPKLLCLSCLAEFKLEESSVMVMVVSTTGEGEPPDTVCKFWRRLKKKSLPTDHLKNLQFALLGLGDSNYTNFCNMGKMMNKRLLELGARPFHDTGYADDGVGLELVVEPWIEGLWSSLEQVFPSTSGETLSSTLVSSDSDVSSARPCQTESTTSPPINTLQTTVVIDERQQTDSSLSSKMDSLTLDRSFVLSRELTSWEKEILLESSTTLWEETPLSVPSIQRSSFSLGLMEVSIISEFNYSESVNGALKGDHHITMATVRERKQLTSEASEKTTLELLLHWNMAVAEQEGILSYQPGDAVCVVCPNDCSEVTYLINRLLLVSEADYVLQLSVLPGAKDKIVPKHIPNQCTIRQYFTHCADIRAIPKKSLLSVLAYYCTNEWERKRLQWLASKHGSADYTTLFVEQRTDLLDILHVFHSCQPPLDALIKVLPRLQPRYYSAASSPISHPNSLKIVFNLISLPQRKWMSAPRTGLCSGWLNQITQDSARVVQVPLYPRLRNPFHLPSDPLVPIIMVGPGTGVAPFMGFLQHRSNQKSIGIPIGKMWLFYGCRHPDKDFIYKDELKLHLSSGVLTHLNVSFSRLRKDEVVEQRDEQARLDNEDRTESFNVEGRYVQDNILAHGVHVVSWIVKDLAAVYVCGDAKHMTRDVRSAFVNILDKHQESSEHMDGATILQEEGRYLVDAWT